MLEKAIEITPADYQIWFNLGNTYVLLKEQQKSIHAYTKALETAEQELAVNPGNGVLLQSVAMYHAVLGQKEKALHFLAQVTGPFAAAPETLYTSAVIYQMVGQPELALNAIHSALLAGFPLNQVEGTAIFAGLRSNKKYLEIIKSHAALAVHQGQQTVN